MPEPLAGARQQIRATEARLPLGDYSGLRTGVGSPPTIQGAGGSERVHILAEESVLSVQSADCLQQRAFGGAPLVTLAAGERRNEARTDSPAATKVAYLPTLYYHACSQRGAPTSRQNSVVKLSFAATFPHHAAAARHICLVHADAAWKPRRTLHTRQEKLRTEAPSTQPP